MAYPTFICAYEKDHNPPLDAEAEIWFQEARVLEKVRGVKNWRKIVWLYDNRVLNKTLAKCSTSTNAW